MIDSNATYPSYSAVVRLQLLVNGRTFAVNKAGPHEIMLMEPAEIEPCTARLLMSIDGKSFVREIRLPTGASASTQIVAIEDASAVAIAESYAG